MKQILALCLSMTPIFASGAEIPELFLKEDFNASVFASAVNHYVEGGPKQAKKELDAIATVWEASETGGFKTGSILATREAYVDEAERLGWVCRVLFEAKPRKALRPPRYGGLMLPWLTMPAKDWPLYPVVRSGHSYFVLAEGYALAGVAETPRQYLEYCYKNGVFRTKRVPLPTRQEAKADAIALWSSPAWKAIKWTDKMPNVEYTIPEDRILFFIENQYESILP